MRVRRNDREEKEGGGRLTRGTGQWKDDAEVEDDIGRARKTRKRRAREEDRRRDGVEKSFAQFS